jgi:hypothetical protein
VFNRFLLLPGVSPCAYPGAQMLCEQNLSDMFCEQNLSVMFGEQNLSEMFCEQNLSEMFCEQNVSDHSLQESSASLNVADRGVSRVELLHIPEMRRYMLRTFVCWSLNPGGFQLR